MIGYGIGMERNAKELEKIAQKMDSPNEELIKLIKNNKDFIGAEELEKKDKSKDEGSKKEENNKDKE